MIARAALPLGLLVLLTADAALAHTGHGVSATLASGFVHPLTGLDHLLAMVAVGLWAAQIGGRALYALPAAFLSLMLIGGLVGMSGAALPAVETMIVGSVLVLGGAIALGRPLPWSLASAMVGGFALFHGFAHGAEMPGAATAASYGVGFLLATAALHGVGIGIGLAFERLAARPLLRFAGAAVLVCGLGLMVQ
jgi:urease accessory protein